MLVEAGRTSKCPRKGGGREITERITKHWDRLPREVLKSLSVQVLKTGMGKAWYNLV